MRFIFHIRPFKYFYKKNWFGIRKGHAWSYIGNEEVWILDLGLLSIGIAWKIK